MRERTFVYKDDDYDVEIVVRQATLSAGFRRYALISREQARLKEREEEGGAADWLTQWAALRTLPSCLCAAAEIRNLDKEKTQLASEMNLDEFLLLPEALVILWERITFECNPHWVPIPKEEESGEVQEPGDSASTNDSSPGSKTKNQKTSQNGTSTT